MSGIPADPFGRSRLPATFDRAGRVALLAECAEALLRGELPRAEARLFLASALRGWLRNGGRLGALERDFLQVSAPRRSTHTASVLWHRMCDDGSTCRATADEPGATMTPEHEQEPNA